MSFYTHKPCVLCRLRSAVTEGKICILQYINIIIQSLVCFPVESSPLAGLQFKKQNFSSWRLLLSVNDGSVTVYQLVA